MPIADQAYEIPLASIAVGYGAPHDLAVHLLKTIAAHVGPGARLLADTAKAFGHLARTLALPRREQSAECGRQGLFGIQRTTRVQLGLL